MLNSETQCPCGSDKHFVKCCMPFIKHESKASSPELLMRSRYSAYASKQYQYLLDTYATQKREKVDISDMSAGEDTTKWLKLEVLSAFEDQDRGEVEFIAYYELARKEIEKKEVKKKLVQKDFYAMHERSRFIQEDGLWRYVDGDMLTKTGKVNLTRNQTCLCGSKLKFKKCCGK